MFQRVKNLWKRIFPMSVKDAEHHMELFNMKLEEIQQKQREEVQKGQQEQQKKFEELFQTFQNNQNTLTQWFNEILDCSKQFTTVQTDGIEQLDKKVQEIIRGDIFRRIEFLQNKVLQLEYLIQSNLLNIQDLRNSSSYQFIQRMRALFPLANVNHSNGFVRMGREHDGGYIMLNDFFNRKIAYSFGIAQDVSWDADIANCGLDVYMYDHTITGLPEHNEKFHFFKIGLGAAENNNSSQLKTLPQILAKNGHQNEYGMILKVDIEGAEWDVLNELNTEILKHFSQIVFEFHSLTSLGNESKISKAMEKLNSTHQLVHVHANNFGSYLLLGGVILPDLLEGTYLLKDEYQFGKNTCNGSAELDQANNQFIPDIFLGSWSVPDKCSDNKIIYEL